MPATPSSAGDNNPSNYSQTASNATRTPQEGLVTQQPSFSQGMSMQNTSRSNWRTVQKQLVIPWQVDWQ
ncbi:hypothetical protein CI109_107257 [Kwoniella shandongensis]|uniref:Uncharacterized protein n=1 Tax=Kwoniella shandongensis TaxID=1734106 RepID=A0A5M6C7L8_9TREE|nr:uncharacterized protein CI109_002540 [Kwoniella shandongensis]KAA5529199.1 hypothetical protein CI109_002540 [Kwoniella shandongensis]